jgi:3-carboxy-cis,cis-muconate cycloisomerase
MLRFEGALALAQAASGIIPQESAKIINDYCNIDLINIEQVKKDIKLGGNTAIPLVKQLTQIVKKQDEEAAKYVHFGATSQDVVDTGIALQIQKYMVWLNEKLHELQQILITLTQKHRQTLMIGRTLLQQARPITFGLKTAKWLTPINQIQFPVPYLTLGGAVGAGNEFINRNVQLELGSTLALNSPSGGQDVLFCCQLGILSGHLGKIAKDISLLMQTEVCEVFEGAVDGKGGSSTMPHKRNPVTCTAILANAIRTPHLVATMLSTMPQEHERSAGLWHAEWETMTELAGLTAGSLEKTIELLSGLEVDKNRMLQNLEITKGLIYAENVSLALAQKIGKTDAHHIIEKACKTAIFEQKHLKTVLQEMKIDLENLDELFKPENSIGNSLEIIDEILNH